MEVFLSDGVTREELAKLGSLDLRLWREGRGGFACKFSIHLERVRLGKGNNRLRRLGQQTLETLIQFVKFGEKERVTALLRRDGPNRVR